MSLDPTRFTKDRVKATPPERVDVAIIGAGMGGLTAGAYLARAGLKVAVFDPHYVAGGCVTQFARGSAGRRYSFDVGLHYVGDCGPDGQIPSMLRDVGVEQEFLPMDPDGFDVILLPGVEFKIPADRERYRERLKAMFPAEAKGIDRYVRFLKEVDLASGHMNRSRGRQTPGMLVDIVLRGRMVARYQNATIGQVLDSCTKDPALRAIMLGQHGDYGLPPSKVAAVLHAGLANHYFKGAYYPRGGGQIIADKLSEAIEAAGGGVYLRRGVAEVIVEGGRAVGVRTEARRGESFEVRARAVLSGADLRHTLLDLVGPEHLPASWVKRVERFEMGGAIFLTCLGIEADMRDLGMGACNYWQFDTTDVERVYADGARGKLDPVGAYITCASLKDPTTLHAPEGVSNVEVMTLLSGKAEHWGVTPEAMRAGRYRQDPAYRERKARVEQALIDRLERFFPGSAERVVFRESATPVTHTRYTRAMDGSGYGLACTPEQFLKKRPGTRGPVDDTLGVQALPS